ncbi:hypothetical protein GCM10009737_05620 [Nocardioides lentus]|uniref:Uncharacterized protein n=1 Tax=Nocardioides lentus TaxID=338077 RepID=A0ABP5A9C6_9ACTN
MRAVARGLAAALASTSLLAATAAPSVAEERVRGVRVGPADDDSVASPLPTRAAVEDRLRDARGTAYLHSHADLRKVAYRTPAVREGGTMTVRATWRDLAPTGRARGVRRGLTTVVDARTGNGGTGYALTRIGRLPRFTLYLLTDDTAGPSRVRPEDLDVRHRPGPRGTTTVTMSTEWLDPGKVSVSSYAEAVGSRGRFDDAYDEVRGTRLRVGPAPQV